MTAETGVFTQRAARRRLAALHDEVGRAGLAAAAAVPGLAAMVDQHAAAVREATTIGLETTAAVAGLALLASYAQGVLDESRERGWTPPTPAIPSWVVADWTALRLTAVCALVQDRHFPARGPLPGERPF